MILKFFILIHFLSVLLSNRSFQFQADGEFVEYKENDITINKLTDNVRVFNDSLFLKTDQAYNYKEVSKLHLYGNTIMIYNLDTLTCDSMIYWTDKDSLLAFGNVQLLQGDRQLNSNDLSFWETSGYRGSSFIAHGDVEILNANNQIQAEYISYNDINQHMILEDDATVLSKGRELFGDYINIHFIDSLFAFINVEGNAIAYNTHYAQMSKDENIKQAVTDIMTGSKINVEFDGNQIKNIILDRMASTIYHAIDSMVLIGVNSVDGDSINLNFDNDQLAAINVQGDARGKFTPEPNNSKIDSIITYKSEHIDYLLNSQESYLSENGQIQYQNMILDADDIHINWNDNTLSAFKKSNKLPVVTTKGSDPMKGDSLKFNLLDKHGTIYKGKTKVDNAYYHGEQIYRDEPNLYHVMSSHYTSCDLDHPHYSFYSDNMKMIPGDRIIARPLILKILDFPIIGIPFAVLPNKGGARHSGWIMPSFGFDNTNGTTMNGLGYYWAPNDYMDSKLLVNFSDRIGLWIANRINYKKRYSIKGHLDFKFVRKLSDTERIEQILSDQTTQQYQINFVHDHKISTSQNFNIKFNYVSSYDFHENTSSDPLANLGSQSSRSSLIYSKSWQESGNAMSIGLSDLTDLKKQKIISFAPVDTTSIIFPTVRANYPGITFSHGLSNLFGNGESWYNKIKWSMSSRYSGYYKKGVYAQSNFTWKDTSNYKNGISHKLQFALPYKLFNWLNITSRANLSEDWIFKYASYQTEAFDSYIMQDGFKRRLTGNFSMSLATKIYGVFPINFKQINSLRHTVTPLMSVSYIPNITKPIMGYDLNTIFTNTGSFAFDADGKLLDPFFSSIVGPTSERDKLIYSFSIQNLFQTKSVSNNNSLDNQQTVAFEKATILDWNIKTTYDAFADSIPWAPLTSRINSYIPGIGSKVDIALIHDIYAMNSSGNRINQYMNDMGGVPIPYLTKLNIRTSFSLSGSRLLSKSISDSISNDLEIDDRKLWSMNLGFSYNKQKKRNYATDTIEWDEQFQLNTSTTLNLSKKWKLSYRVGFDLIEQTMGLQSFVFTRDLHCWQFKFNWIPGRSYFLHIHIKKPELRDIKLESRSKNDRNNFF